MICWGATGQNVLGLAGTATNLGEQQINTERSALVVEVALQLSNLLAKHVWGVTNASKHTEASGIGDGGSELGTGSHVHAGKQNGVLNLQQVGELRADLLCTLSVRGT